MRRTVIAATVSVLAIGSASAHCFRIWHYPHPQRCQATALAPRSAMRLPKARINVSVDPPRPAPHRPVVPTPDLPIPSLADIVWGQLPDDEERGRLLLRAILQGKSNQ